MTNARTTRTAREKAAELRAQAERAQARRRTLLVGAAVAAVIVVVVGIVVLVKVASNGSGNQPPTVAAGNQPSGLVSGGFQRGSASATVTIELYEDFQCPVCKAFEAANGAQLKAWVDAGTAKVIYHPVAILDSMSSTQYSTRSANAAAAVQSADPAAFPAFHDLLYANQPVENGTGLTDSQLIDYAVQAGVTRAAVEPAITGQKYVAWVGAQTDEFSKKGFTGTPTVVVDGKQLGGSSVPSPDELKATVTAAAK